MPLAGHCFGALTGPCSVDFPPEINSKQVARLYLAEVLKEANLAQNDFKLPENQEIEINLWSRFRPGGPKIGHKGAF